ncbi:MAG TPA: hypothetical protein VNJ08_16110 [Bacteriovoracaceae bacterium]|nr:hypothetical protein [Bacteriovoracaceae bacterium]
MKTKKTLDNKFANAEKDALMGSKPKSLRPMRSMMAVRSLKSRTTTVAGIMVKSPEASEKI